MHIVHSVSNSHWSPFNTSIAAVKEPLSSEGDSESSNMHITTGSTRVSISKPVSEVYNKINIFWIYRMERKYSFWSFGVVSEKSRPYVSLKKFLLIFQELPESHNL